MSLLRTVWCWMFHLSTDHAHYLMAEGVVVFYCRTCDRVRPWGC